MITEKFIVTNVWRNMTATSLLYLFGNALIITRAKLSNLFLQYKISFEDHMTLYFCENGTALYSVKNGAFII